MEYDVLREHNVVDLFNKIPKNTLKELDINEESIKAINTINADTKDPFPYNLGLLPTGLPTEKDFEKLYGIAYEIFEKIRQFLENKS